MFRVFLENGNKYEFLSYNEFAAWRLKMSHEGYKPYYSHSIRIRCGYCIYCYQLRKMPGRGAEAL